MSRKNLEMGTTNSVPGQIKELKKREGKVMEKLTEFEISCYRHKKSIK